MKKPITSLHNLCSPLIRIFFIVLLGVMVIFATSMGASAHSTSQVVSQNTADEFSCYTTLDIFYLIPSNSAPLHVYFATYATPSGQDMVTVQQTGPNDFVWTLQSTGEWYQDAITDPQIGDAHFGVTILQTQQVQAVPSGDDIVPSYSPVWEAGICNTWYADGAKIGGYP